MKISHLPEAQSSPDLNKLGKVLAIGALALGLLLGASAQAQTVITRDGDPSQAIEIRDLVIGSRVYVVQWVFADSTEAYPEGLPFSNRNDAQAAAGAINAALNAVGGITGVGENVTVTPGEKRPLYEIGYFRTSITTSYWLSATEETFNLGHL